MRRPLLIKFLNAVPKKQAQNNKHIQQGHWNMKTCTIFFKNSFACDHIGVVAHTQEIFSNHEFVQV
jgi:hypothetical protein